MLYTQSPPSYTGPKAHGSGTHAEPHDEAIGGSSSQRAPLLGDGPREEGDIDPDAFK